MNVTKIKIGKPFPISIMQKQLQKECDKQRFDVERFAIKTNGNTFLFNNVDVELSDSKNRKMILVSKRLDHRMAMVNDGIFTEYYLIKETILTKKREKSDNTLSRIIEKESEFYANNKTVRNSTSTAIYL